MHRLHRLCHLLLVVLLAACSSRTGASGAFQQGKEYTLATHAAAPADGHKVLVQEFFWYGCPHCFAFDPTLREWVRQIPRDVSFERVPATLGRPVGVLHARAFYIAQILRVSDSIHIPLFEAIHEGGRPLETLDDLRSFFGEKALVAATAFDVAANDPLVESRLRRADELARNYGVTGVPTMVVDGRYLTDGGMAGDFSRMLQVVDFLVEKARKERKL